MGVYISFWRATPTALGPGSAFLIQDFTQFCTNHGVTQVFSPVADHRGTGVVERSIRTLRERTGTYRLSLGSAFAFKHSFFSVL